MRANGSHPTDLFIHIANSTFPIFSTNLSCHFFPLAQRTFSTPSLNLLSSRPLPSLVTSYFFLFSFALLPHPIVLPFLWNHTNPLTTFLPPSLSPTPSHLLKFRPSSPMCLSTGKFPAHVSRVHPSGCTYSCCHVSETL